MWVGDVVTLEATLELFLASLERTGRASGTRLKYASVLEPFVAEHDGLEPGAVTAAAVESYLSRWRARFVATHGRPPAPATSKGQVTALRAFFAFLARMDVLRTGSGARVPNPMLAIETLEYRSGQTIGSATTSSAACSRPRALRTRRSSSRCCAGRE